MSIERRTMFKSVSNQDKNVNIFQPKRCTEVLARNVRKFYPVESYTSCQEFRQLSFQISKADASITYKHCRLVLPLRIRAAGNLDMGYISTRISDGFPACNIAIAADPLRMFKTIECSLNGKVYTETSDYKYIVNKCFPGSSEMSYANSGSCKPIYWFALSIGDRGLATYDREPVHSS